MSRGLKIALVAALVAILVGLLVVVLVAVVFVNVISAPADVANGYVRAIGDGDLDAAWGYLASETRSEEGRSGFESKVEGLEGRIESHDTSSIEVENNTARIAMDLEFDDGSTGTWEMFLVKENGSWKVRQVAPGD